MRVLWTIIRVLIVLACLGTLLVTVLFVSSPSGTTIDASGAIIDAVALVVLIVVAWSLWRDRHALV
jgi:hypothetical protein